MHSFFLQAGRQAGLKRLLTRAMMNSSINSTSTYTPGPGLFYEDHEPEFEVYNLDLVQMSPGDFNVDSSYHSLDPIGRGSYGVVWWVFHIFIEFIPSCLVRLLTCKQASVWP